MIASSQLSPHAKSLCVPNLDSLGLPPWPVATSGNYRTNNHRRLTSKAFACILDTAMLIFSLCLLVKNKLRLSALCALWQSQQLEGRTQNADKWSLSTCCTTCHGGRLFFVPHPYTTMPGPCRQVISPPCDNRRISFLLCPCGLQTGYGIPRTPVFQWAACHAALLGICKSSSCHPLW